MGSKPKPTLLCFDATSGRETSANWNVWADFCQVWPAQPERGMKWCSWMVNGAWENMFLKRCGLKHVIRGVLLMTWSQTQLEAVREVFGSSSLRFCVAEKIPKVLGKVELKLSMKMVFLIPSHPIDESSISLCFPMAIRKWRCDGGFLKSGYSQIIHVTSFSGWWFGTWILFFHSVGNVIIPTEFHIFQRDRSTTNQFYLDFP